MCLVGGLGTNDSLPANLLCLFILFLSPLVGPDLSVSEGSGTLETLLNAILNTRCKLMCVCL